MEQNEFIFLMMAIVVVTGIFLVVRNIFAKPEKREIFKAKLIFYHDMAWLCEYFDGKEFRRGLIYMPEEDGFPGKIITVEFECVEFVNCFLPIAEEDVQP